MSDLLLFAAFIIVWFILGKFVLPKIGIHT